MSMNGILYDPFQKAEYNVSKVESSETGRIFVRSTGLRHITSGLQH